MQSCGTSHLEVYCSCRPLCTHAFWLMVAPAEASRADRAMASASQPPFTRHQHAGVQAHFTAPVWAAAPCSRRSTCAGTSQLSVEGRPCAVGLSSSEALPASCKARPALWPPPVQAYPTFQRMAGLVQSRSFHMLKQNWVTGAASEGGRLG